MNALLWTPNPHEDAVLWLCVKHPPQTLTNVARLVGRKVGTVCANVQKLKSHGYLDRAHGSMTPYPVALERVRWLEEQGYDFAKHVPEQAPQAVSSVGLPPAMEPRGSIELPPDALIDALASFQDQLLQAANAQLRLEVTELRAECDALRARCERCLLLLAQAADAITG